MKKKQIKLLVASLLFLVVFFSILAWANVEKDMKEGQTSSGIEDKEAGDGSLLETLNKNNEEILSKIDTRQAIVFALYGTDERAVDDVGRSDIIMVISYNPINKNCVMVSLPRDLRVNIPSYGLDKINHAYAYGGRALSDQTIEDLLGMTLDFSLKVDFETFSKIIDDFGGVLVNAKKDFPYNDGRIAIKQGSNRLNGKDALFYVRFRSDADGDYGRIERQQEVLIALLDQISDLGIKKIDGLIKKYYNKGVETNASLAKLEEYLNLSSRDQEIIFENYRLETHSQLIDGLWYELYEQADLDAIKNILVENQTAT